MLHFTVVSHWQSEQCAISVIEMLITHCIEELSLHFLSKKTLVRTFWFCAHCPTNNSNDIEEPRTENYVLSFREVFISFREKLLPGTLGFCAHGFRSNSNDLTAELKLEIIILNTLFSVVTNY